MVFCHAIVSSGELETFSVAKEGSSFSVGLSVVVVCVLSDCWASMTFALGFLRWPFDSAAGWVEGGVEDTRSGVEAAIAGPPCSRS